MTPLRGVRVLDLGRYIAAPYCSMILGDLGAEVIRIEPPGGGHDRVVGLCGPHGENMSFSAIGRGKRSVSLDLRHPDARRVLHDLVRVSDVLVHNFGPATLERFGLASDELQAVRPELVIAAVSCFGATGPYGDRLGFDPMAQATSGAMSLTGLEGEAPMRSGVPWVDYSTGLSAAMGTLAALLERGRTGRGQTVDCSLLDTAVSFTAPAIAEAVALERERPRLGNRPPYLGPNDLYRCADGWVYASTVTPRMWRSFAVLIGQSQWLDDPRLQTDAGLYAHRAEVDPVVQAWMVERSAARVIELLEAAGIPCAPMRTTGEVAEDPQVRARDLLPTVEVDHVGPVPACRTPARFGAAPLPELTRAPSVGEHNESVYCDLLGYSREWLGALCQRGVV